MTTAATHSDEVRVLPFRVRPLPDEPFDSWLEMMAATYGATMNEMAHALGLIDQRRGVAVSTTGWMANGWATDLTDDQVARLEQSTGIPADQFHEMTRMRFAQHAIRYTRQGRISVVCPAGGTSGRYCPECLADSGGRWRMSWQFPFGFTCPRHRRLLVDRCPACQLPARNRAHPLALVPEPGRCHNPVDGPGRGPQPNRCRADLTEDLTRTPVPGSVLEAQRAMMRIVSTGEGRLGIYAGAPQQAVPVLEDIRLLSRTARDALVAGEHLDTTPVGDELLELFRASEDWTEGLRVRPHSAAGAAVGTTLAHLALTDPDLVVALLRGRLATSTSYSAHTPQLQTLIASALGRTRRPTAFLQSAPPSGVSPAERARKVPAQLWDDWIARYAPRRFDHEIAASALAAAVVFTGTRLTHSAALALLDPHAPVRQVTHVMRDLGRSSHDTDTLQAVLRLAAFLDSQDVPIDYARRRRLDYTELLPEPQWGQLCREARVSPGGGRRWQLARAVLHRTLSGNPLRARPAAWPTTGLTPHVLARFVEEMPTPVRERLDRIAADFLTAHRIDEPVTWTPEEGHPVPETDLQSLPSSWPPIRPAQAAAAGVVSSDELVRAYAAGASTYEIAAEAQVSRQTVSRVLTDSGTSTRRGRPRRFDIDPQWLRGQYVTQQKTIPQIADVVGCSVMTINRHLHAAGIPVRPVGAGSAAAAIHPHILAGDSRLLRQVFVGRHGVLAAERFLIVATSRTVQEAALQIGVATASLQIQVQNLAGRAGGPLLIPAKRGTPLRLTELGARLADEVRLALPGRAASPIINPGSAAR